MEDVDNSEIQLAIGKDDLIVESKNETSHDSSVICAVNTISRTDEFLKHEGYGVDNKNHVFESSVDSNSFHHNESSSHCSSSLVSAESVPVTSSAITEDLPVTKNVEESKQKPQTPMPNDSDEVNMVASTESKGYPNENDKLGKGDNLEVKDDCPKISPEGLKNSKLSESELSGDHDVTLENMGNAEQEPTASSPEDNSGVNNELSSGTDKEPTEEWMDILGSGHLMKKVLKPGIPDSRPQKSDLCILSLIGRLEDGTVVEQSENLEINLSDNEVIQGLDFALALMEKGEEAEIKVTPRFGYGSLGKRPEIPPGANLVYTVTLLDVREEPQIHTLNVTERIKNGLRKKERGNWWYSRDENTLAINCYRRALDYFDDTDIPEPHNEEEVRKLIEERLKTYNNLGAAQMKISAFDAALMSVNNVLAAQPENVKALFRKSKVLKEKGELQESINVVKKALSYEPESQTLHQELSSLMAAQRKVNSKQRELYKKMMGNSNNETDEDKKKNSKNNYKTFTLVAVVSFAVAVLGTIVVKYKF